MEAGETGGDEAEGGSTAAAQAVTTGEGYYFIDNTEIINEAHGAGPKTAQKLFDFLLSSSTEEELIDMNAVGFSLLLDKTKNKEPMMWLPSPKKTATFLKQSAELIREYLD